MSTFSQQAAAYKTQRATVAPATIILHPNDFASDWAQRPADDICCGLRVLSADAEDSAKAEARKKVVDSDGDIETELRRQYLIQYCALSLCDPNDVERHCEPFDMASDQLPVALTSNALLRIYDTAERLKIESSPLFSEATDDDAADLAGELLGGALEDLATKDTAKAARCRRYLRFVLDDLRE
jgi:hypothetical protein